MQYFYFSDLLGDYDHSGQDKQENKAPVLWKVCEAINHLEFLQNADADTKSRQQAACSSQRPYVAECRTAFPIGIIGLKTSE